MDSFFVQPPFFYSRLRQHQQDKIEINTKTMVSTKQSHARSYLHATIGVEPSISSADTPGVSHPNLIIESYTLNQLGPVDSEGNRVLYRVNDKENGITATITQLNANAVPRVRKNLIDKMIRSVIHSL